MRSTARSRCLEVRVAARACALLALCLGQPAWPGQAAADRYSVFVVIDDESLDSLGAFPVDRKLYGRIIEKARQYGAKGIALKFFFERPGNPESDAELARSMTGHPVLLQVASAPADRPASTEPPSKLFRPDWRPDPQIVPYPLQGVAPPIEPLLKESAALGFVEARPDGLAGKVEVIGKLGERFVASLQVAILETATGTPARVEGRAVTLGRVSLPLDGQGRVDCPSITAGEPRRYGIGAFLGGGVPRDAVRDKVVVLGYGRSNSPTLAVAGRAMPIHEIFYRQVSCLGRLLEPTAGS